MPAEILLLTTPIDPGELRRLTDSVFGDMVKYVVDVERGRLAIGGEMHADAERILLDAGSRQSDLWGANFYPDRPEGERIEYTSLINIRPRVGNRSMELADPALRELVRALTVRLLEGGGEPR